MRELRYRLPESPAISSYRAFWNAQFLDIVIGTCPGVNSSDAIELGVYRIHVQPNLTHSHLLSRPALHDISLRRGYLGTVLSMSFDLLYRV